MDDNHTLVCGKCAAVNRIPKDRMTGHPVCGKCKTPLFSGKPFEVSGPLFRKHIEKTSIPVIVDFWAPWCGPCKMMIPVFKEAATRLEPYYRLVKLNTDADQQTAAQYRIQSIPTIALFKGGREITRKPGAVDISALIKWVKSQS